MTNVCHKRAIPHTDISASIVDSCLDSCLSSHLIVNVLGVQAMIIVSISLHVLPVPGADDHDDEH